MLCVKPLMTKKCGRLLYTHSLFPSISTKRGFIVHLFCHKKLFQCWKLCGCVNCGVDQKMDGWPGTPIISSLESSSLLLCVSYSHPSSSTIIYICYSNNIQPVNTHFFYAISNYLPCSFHSPSIFLYSKHTCHKLLCFLLVVLFISFWEKNPMFLRKRVKWKCNVVI